MMALLPQKAILSITIDRSCSYKYYLQLDDEIYAGYEEIRDHAAHDLYKTCFQSSE